MRQRRFAIAGLEYGHVAILQMYNRRIVSFRNMMESAMTASRSLEMTNRGYMHVYLRLPFAIQNRYISFCSDAPIG